MPDVPAGVHRLHGVLLWTILVAVLLAAGAFGLILGVAVAKAPPDPIARTSPTPIGQNGVSPPSLSSPMSIRSLSVRLLPGWNVTSRSDTSLEVVAPHGDGLVFFQSDRHQPSEPAAQIVTEVTAATARKYPDVRTCLVPVPLAVGSASGSVFGLCYTFIPQSGRAYEATDVFWVATNRDGSIFYLYEVFAPADTFNNLNMQVEPMVRSVVWKLV